MVAIPKPSSVFPGGISWLNLRYAFDHCLDGIPNLPQLQCLEWPLNLRLENFLIFGGIHSSFPSHSISCSSSCNTTAKHNGSLFFTVGVFLHKGFIHSWPKDFGFISRKYIPKGFRLLIVFFCILQMHNFVLRLLRLSEEQDADQDGCRNRCSFKAELVARWSEMRSTKR